MIPSASSARAWQDAAPADPEPLTALATVYLALPTPAAALKTLHAALDLAPPPPRPAVSAPPACKPKPRLATFPGRGPTPATTSTPPHPTTHLPHPAQPPPPPRQGNRGRALRLPPPQPQFCQLALDHPEALIAARHPARWAYLKTAVAAGERRWLPRRQPHPVE